MSRAGEVYAGFRSGDLTERDNLEDLGTDCKVVLKWIFNNWIGMDWTDLPKDRDR
jgi:hypothetical protein